MATVLVIDDDAGLRRLLALNLVTSGFTARTAEHGAAGFLELGRELPDLIVLDLMMPVMDGGEFCRLLRAAGYTIPVIILSAYGAERWEDMGAQASMRKPFDPDALIMLINDLLNGQANSGV